MRQIPISADPNQQFSVRLDDTRYALRFKEANGVMVADVDIDGVPILTATRVLAGEPIIPYLYLQRGNFFVLSDNDELPTYELFGVSQQLVYIGPAELAAL